MLNYLFDYSNIIFENKKVNNIPKIFRNIS